MTAAGLDRGQSVNDPWRISARELSAKKIQGSYAEWANTSAISIASEWFMPLSCAVLMLTRASPKLTSQALRMEGVIGVLTAADMPGLKTIPMRTDRIPDLERSQQFPIATTKVRYVGDPVAVVVAASRYIAEDAIELIDVAYEAVGPVTDARQSMQLVLCNID